jgi:hypothetical protein
VRIRLVYVMTTRATAKYNKKCGASFAFLLAVNVDTMVNDDLVYFDKILELGVISHSAIIGLSLGVSQSPCTIKPLVAALSFQYFLEGFALGSCISEVNILPSFVMCINSLLL